MKFSIARVFTLCCIILLFSLESLAQENTLASLSPSPYLMERVANEEWILIDVRTPEEFAEGHIPGAINIPHDEIGNYLAELEMHKGKPIIVYCRSGRRAKLAMKVLTERSFPEVRHLEGDILGWSSAGLPLESM